MDCTILQGLIGSIAASAAIVTASTAVIAYRLAKKNLGFTADKHDRESVSIVFQSIDISRYVMKATFVIYNRANVDLIIEDIFPKLASITQGWKVSFYTSKNIDNESKEPKFVWSEQGRNIQNYSASSYRALAIVPESKMLIKAEILMHDAPSESLNLGKIKARLCYNQAKSREYEMVIPDVPDIQRIMKAQLALVNGKKNL